jgi:hypothetical protein
MNSEFCRDHRDEDEFAAKNAASRPHVEIFVTAGPDSYGGIDCKPGGKMTRAFTVTMRDRSTGEEERTRVAIPDEDWQTLVAFAAAVEELQQSSCLQNGLAVNVKIRGNLIDGVTAEGALPESDRIAALLHRVRPFVLQDEPLSYFRVRNILARHVNNAGFRRLLEEQKDEFSGKEFQCELKITSSAPGLTGVLNSDDSFQMWLNGFEYHRDAEKRANIEQLCGMLPFDVARAIFVSMLIDKVRAILNLAVIIRRCETGDGQPLVC